VNGDEPLGLRKGQRPQQRRVHDAEDGGRPTDPKCQRRYGHDGPGGSPAQDPYGIANIPGERIERRQSSPIAVLFSRLLEATQLETSLTPGSVWVHTRAKVVVDMQL